MIEDTIGQITYNHTTGSYELLGDQLHCGQTLEVLVCNGLHAGEPEWISTRFELDGEDNGYLVGLIGYQTSGLFARKS